MDELETQAQGTPEGAAPQEEVPAEPAVTDAATPEEGQSAEAQPAQAQPEEAPKPESAPEEVAQDQAAQPETPQAEEGASEEAEPAEAAEGDAAGQSSQEAQTISIEEWMASSQQTVVVEAPTPADLEDTQLLAVLEACVYVAEEPLIPAQIAAALKQEPERIRGLMQQLMTEFDKPEHGLCIKEVAGGYKMSTKPEHHEAVRAFVKSLKAPLKLSLPALETLAVVAYKQPCTGPEIMEIRGVQGGGVLKTLLDRKLITEAGRKNVIGKPILYKTTKEFLITFGLKDLSELPTLKEFEEIRRMAMSEPEAPAEAAAPETAPQAEAPAPSAPEASAQEVEAEAPAAVETPAEAPANSEPETSAQEAEAEAPAAVETPAEAPANREPETPAQEAEAEAPAPEASAPEPEPEKPATTESQEP